MAKENFSNFDAIHEGNADQLDLDGTTDGRESITAARTVTGESDNGVETPDSVSVEQDNTQSNESAATVSVPEVTLDMSKNYRVTIRYVDKNELDQHLINTEQRPRIATELGGVFEGSAPDIPCPTCGNDEPVWLRDKFRNFICRKCLANGKYTLYRWVMDCQNAELPEALSLIAQRSGFDFRDICSAVKAKANGEPYEQYEPLLDRCLGGHTLYSLQHVLEGAAAIIVKGEETADCLRRVLRAADIQGVAATTSPMGTADESFWEGVVQQHPTIADKRIIIIPDNDEAGMNYARTVARILMGANPSESVKIVELNDRPLRDGGNLMDWFVSLIKAGTEAPAMIEVLSALCASVEPLTPDIVASWVKPSEEHN